MKKALSTLSLIVLLGLGAVSAYGWVGICGLDHTGCSNLGTFEGGTICYQRYECDGVQGEERCSCGEHEYIW